MRTWLLWHPSTGLYIVEIHDDMVWVLDVRKDTSLLVPLGERRAVITLPFLDEAVVLSGDQADAVLDGLERTICDSALVAEHEA